MLERRDEDAIGSAREKRCEMVLRMLKRQRPNVVALSGRHVESVKLHLVVMPAGMQRREV